MKVKAKDLVSHAYLHKYAVPAINVSNLETIMGAFEAAEALKSPIILQISPIQLEHQHLSLDLSVALVDMIASKYLDVRYALHLDHATSYTFCKAAVESGYESIMFDGSARPFEENLDLTKQLRLAFETISLEGEVGSFMTDEGITHSDDKQAHLTDPKQALKYVEETKVDFLAIAFGNNHGFYKSEPKLDFDLLKTINDLINIPIVLHGGTGIDVKDIQKAISLGVAKVNFFTQCDYAFTQAFIEAGSDGTYMMKAAAQAQKAFSACVMECIELCKSKGVYDG